MLVFGFSGMLFTLSVVCGIFGGTIYDKVVYFLGSVILCVVLAVGVRLADLGGLLRKALDPANRKDLMQVFCFAAVTTLTLYYYDSANEVHHQIALCMMDAFLGIAILAMFERSEWNRKWHRIISAILVIGVIGYIIWYNGTCMGDIHRTLRLWRAYIYLQIAFCVIGRIRERRFLKHVSLFGIPAAAVMIGMVIFRNTRTWPFSVAIPFLCLYFFAYEKGGQNRVVRNYAYGTMVSFWMMFLTALLFRPYYSFEFVRYPGWFASCASAGLFWTVVLAAAFAAVLSKYKKEGCVLRDAFWEILTFAFAAVHVLFAMARTTFLAIAVFGAFAFILAEVVCYRDSLRGMIRRIALFILPVIVLLPTVYTLIRCVPAIVARPFWVSKPEWFSDRIMPGEAPDSSKYMNVPQLAESFLEKIVGIDINLSMMAGAESGPGNVTVDENGNEVMNENVVATYEHDGQTYAVKDYTFSNDSDEETSNGRFTIFKIYFDRLNLTGHDTMVPQDRDQSILIYHAHNSFMQIFYDHGVIVGILFVLMTIGGLIRAVLYYRHRHETENFAIYPVIVVISFMISGMTEWIFHPSIPSGFAFLIALLPLIPKIETEHEENRMEL